MNLMRKGLTVISVVGFLTVSGLSGQSEDFRARRDGEAIANPRACVTPFLEGSVAGVVEVLSDDLQNVVILIDERESGGEPDGKVDEFFVFAPPGTSRPILQNEVTLANGHVEYGPWGLRVSERGVGRVLELLVARQSGETDRLASLQESPEWPLSIGRITEGLALSHYTGFEAAASVDLRAALRSGGFSPALTAADRLRINEVPDDSHCLAGGFGALSCGYGCGGNSCNVSCGGGMFACCYCDGAIPRCVCLLGN